MIEYIYFVKCPSCEHWEDEHFSFFNDAKDFALSCLSNKPIITQIEVDRNDFGECVDSHDLGTVWSWEDVMSDVPSEPEFSVLDKSATLDCDDLDAEFDALDNSLDSVPDNFRKPIPANMTIEELVEEMEENEDEVECKWCHELFDKSECSYEVDLGWLCDQCTAAIKSRGETLTFKENNYWDLDESLDADTISTTINTILAGIADNISNEDKSKVISNLITFVTPEKLEEVWTYIKDNLKDRALTEEDKDALVRKLNIERSLLDGVDTVLTAVSVIITVAPLAIGIVWDILELTPIEDLAVGAATGGWGAIVTTILSVIPEKTIISALLSVEIYLGSKVVNMIKDFIIHKVIPEPNKDIKESASKSYSWDAQPVELEYDKLDVTLQGVEKQSGDPYEPPYRDEWDETVSYTYEADPTSVVEFLWDIMTDEDVAEIPGGFEAMEADDALFNSFMNNHFDELVTKYMDKLLVKFEDDARSEYEDSYNPYEAEANAKADYWDSMHHDFDESCNSKAMLEELEEAEDYNKRLIDCPECGNLGFDSSTGICIKCGFN